MAASHAVTNFAPDWQRAVSGDTLTGLDERELLRRFIANRDALAFEMIVTRHGPMVLSVCRRMLHGDAHAADDAFQATFLVLVKRARSIRDPGRLGPWLYGVAHRVARRARSTLMRQRVRERGTEHMQPQAVTPEQPDIDAAALHEELNRLPRAYRDVIVTCDLERATHEQAAQRLGWPIGTVKGRLSRAREQLRNRLVKRGVTLAAPALLVSLEREAAAALPAPLVDATVRSASVLVSNFATGGAGVVSASVLALTEGVTQAMTLSKLGMTAGVLLVAGTFTSAGMLAAQFGSKPIGAPGTAASNQDTPSSKASKPATSEDEKAHAAVRAELERQQIADESIAAARAGLDKARLEVLGRNYNAWASQLIQSVPQWDMGMIRETRAASMALMAATSDAKAAAEGHLERMAELERSVTDKLEKHWANTDRMNAFPGGGSGISRDNHPVIYMGYGETKLPELGVLVAEARLWVAEAAAGQPLTASDALISLPLGGATANTTPVYDAQTRAILRALDSPAELRVEGEVSLADFLKGLREVTRSPELAKGLPIYIDPAGLVEAEKTVDSSFTITFDFAEVPLKTALRLVLKQLELAYMVKDGLVVITYVGSQAFTDDGIVIGDRPVPGYGNVPLTGLPPADAGGIGGPPGPDEGANVPKLPTQFSGGGGFR